MKKKLSILFFVLTIWFSANAKTYYVSNAGNDANSGLSTSTPWKTVAKVSSFKTFVSGDQILFNRGEVFYGKLLINNSGTSGNPITFGAYGSGSKPVITGFTTVSAWTNLGSNIWESTNAVSSLIYTKMVIVNGKNTPMGRYPNTTTLPYQSYANGTSITSSSLTGSPNWTGAELAMYVSTYDMGRNKITSQSGGTLNYVYSSKDGPIQYAPNWFYPSFFIQNDARTLDAVNEWYYNPSTKKLRIYNTTTPSNVQLATVDTIVTINNFNYITIDNIYFQGANTMGVCVRNSKYCNIQNCDFNFSGRDGIFGPYWGNSTNLKIDNCTINNSNNTGIDLSGDFTNATVQYTTIKNSGMIIGMGGTGSDNGTGSSGGLLTLGANTLMQYNSIDSTGYIAVVLAGNNSALKNNLINNFCRTLRDGGGIYTSNASGSNYSGMKIVNNIILNSAAENGIYIDEKSNGIEITGNTIANCNWGIYLHNNWNIKVYNNTTYNNGSNNGTGFLFDNFDPLVATRDIDVKNNIFFAKNNNQNTGYFTLINGIFPTTLTLDSNYYVRPIEDVSTIFTNFAKVYSYKTLTAWKTVSGKDAHSKQSPKSITDLNDLRFEYNATNSSKTISLPYNYIDARNKAYNGSITLAPYTSAVLIKNGSASNQSPKANAGSDQTIILPSSSVSLSGSGSDPDGSISAYSWAKISGTGGTIISSASAATTVTSLVQGTYLLQLTVTDNAGAKGQDTVQVTVNAAGGTLLPAVNPSNTVNGMDYRYYEGTGYSVIPTFSSLTPLRSGSTPTFDLSLANRATIFAFSFTGYINVPSDGQYTFYTTSDDGSNLYIDNVLVVNNDGLHGSIENSGVIGLKAGKHAISVGYFQQTGGSILNVSYAGPSISKQLVPSSSLYRILASSLLPAVYPANTVNGLDYRYYEGTSYSVIPTFSSLTPLRTGNTPTFDLSLANRAEIFAFSFTGYISVPSDGQYTFYTTSDDGSNLYIDNVLVVNNDGLHGSTEKSGTIGLQAGKHAISVGYFNQYGGKILGVSYSGGGLAKQAVPSSALYRILGLGRGLAPENINVSSATAIPEISASIKAFPNPFINSLLVNITGEAGEFKLTLVDVLGRVILTKNGLKSIGSFQQSINTSSLQRGSYFLKLVLNNNTTVMKLQK